MTKKSAEKVKRVVRAIGMSFKIMKNRLKVFKYFMIFFLTQGKVPAHQTDESNTESESDTKKSKVRKYNPFLFANQIPIRKRKKRRRKRKRSENRKNRAIIPAIPITEATINSQRNQSLNFTVKKICTKFLVQLNNSKLSAP